MPQALIKVNAVVGSDTDLPINVLVSLDNQNTGGELTYRWAMLDEPPGPTDALSSLVIQSPTFTPKKEGTYLLELVVNEFLPTEARDRVVCSVLQVKTGLRVPAAGEDTEADATDGWAVSADEFLRTVDVLRADPGVFIAKVTGAPVPSLSRGNVVWFSGSEVLKAGLPGEERIAQVRRVGATLADQQYDNLGIIEGSPHGGVAWDDGDFVFVRRSGIALALPTIGVPVVGQPMYVGDGSVLEPAPGTYWRRAGLCLAFGGGVFDLSCDSLTNEEAQNFAVIRTTVGADQNNYQPTDWRTASTAVIEPTGADRSITGALGIDGLAAHGVWRKTIINGSTTRILTLVHQSGLSLLANRFICPAGADFMLAQRGSVDIEYDRAALAWQVVAAHLASGVVFGNPVSVGTANAPGASANAARADHVHDHGAQPLGTGNGHAVATGAVAGFASAADKTKLDRLSVVKEMWFPQDALANFSTTQRTKTFAASGTGRFMFATPADFGSLVSIDAIMMPVATNAAANIDLTSEYGALGASAIGITQTDNASTYALVANQLKAISLATVFGSLAANQQCGVLISHTTIGGSSEYYGIRLRYNVP